MTFDTRLYLLFIINKEYNIFSLVVSVNTKGK